MEGMNSDNLLALKDDMIAFIEGHGMRHFPALIPEDTPRVWWNSPDQSDAEGTLKHEILAESWKDFVEMAKVASAPMVCIGEDTLDKTTLELLAAEVEDITGAERSDSRQSGLQMEKVHRLFLEVGKLGHIELAFPHQGILFVHETSTEWYRNYREMVNSVDHLHELIENTIDGMDEEQE